MYAVIRRYVAADPNRADEAIQRAETGLVPLLRKVPGFVSYTAVNAGNGIVASLTLNQDKVGADESSNVANAWIRQHNADILQGTAEIYGGEAWVTNAEKQPA